MEYLVYNNTDGFIAHHESFGTKQEAQEFINEFPKRFERQGYYLTADRIKINPNEVDLRIHEVEV